MKTIEIQDKTLTLFEGGEDGKIGVKFNSQELDLDNFFFRNNGLEKETKITRIVLDIEQNKIFTEKKTYSLTPTGDKIDTIQNPVFETAESDVNLFMQQAIGLLVPAALNGIVRDMGITRAVMNLDGSIITNQPVPIPDETSD